MICIREYILSWRKVDDYFKLGFVIIGGFYRMVYLVFGNKGSEEREEIGG